MAKWSWPINRQPPIIEHINFKNDRSAPNCSHYPRIDKLKFKNDMSTSDRVPTPSAPNYSHTPMIENLKFKSAPDGIQTPRIESQVCEGSLNLLLSQIGGMRYGILCKLNSKTAEEVSFNEKH